MTIFTRHMVGRFVKPFVFGLGLFVVLIFLGDTFDKMNYIVKSKAPLGIILECLWLGVPYWAVRVIPMATLLATLTAMSGFVQSGEWLATQACGLETKRFWMPLLGASLAIAGLAFVAQETIMPAAWARSQRLWHMQVHPQWEWTQYPAVALDAGEGRFVNAWLFIPLEGRLNRPTMDQFGPEGITSELDSKYALWDAAQKRWVFYRGVERTWGPLGVTEHPFASKVSDFDTPPLDLIPRPVDPDELTLRQIVSYGKRIGRFGGSPRAYEVGAWTKIAYPFANLVICALGIPIALRLRKSSRVLSFCGALAISFIYLWCMEVARAMGVSGTLPAWAAAWSANALFGATAFVLIKRWDL